MSTYVVSEHAIDQYRSRVQSINRAAARAALEELLSGARLRPTPRHWMREETRYGHGVRFGYSPSAPHVALVLRGSTVVTVLTRSLYRRRRGLLGDGRERGPDRKQRRKSASRRDSRRSRERTQKKFVTAKRRCR